MKKSFIHFSSFIFFLLINRESYSQNQTPLLNQIIKDKYDKTILIGLCDTAPFTDGLYKEWFKPEYDYYKVDTATCKLVNKVLNNQKLLIFIATWCDDSRREFPHLIKILEYCNYPIENLSIIALGSKDTLYKQSTTGIESGRSIEYIPTLIIEEDNNEIGRIVEYPVVSLEKDLLKILRREKYKPNYSAN